MPDISDYVPRLPEGPLAILLAEEVHASPERLTLTVRLSEPVDHPLLTFLIETWPEPGRRDLTLVPQGMSLAISASIPESILGGLRWLIQSKPLDEMVARAHEIEAEASRLLANAQEIISDHREG